MIARTALAIAVLALALPTATAQQPDFTRKEDVIYARKDGAWKIVSVQITKIPEQ